MTAWARPDSPAGEWMAGMKPYTIPSLLEQFASSDPTRVPATIVLGAPTVIASTPQGETLRVSTDGGRVDVVLERSGTSCLVRDLYPAQDIPVAPTPVLTATAVPTSSAPTGG